MPPEKVFEILAEGGSIGIYLQKTHGEEVFLYRHNEVDIFDLGLAVNKELEFKSFEEAFEQISQNYPWYRLHISTVHSDFRAYIIEKLIDKLNSESIAPQDLEYSKHRLEEALNIELKYSEENGVRRWGRK